ncbi:MAG: molybdopterin-dependent oxidoreductase, partial [Armatimonadetes bacterium]|nr:molybdopterin-dependent oxidoreductase [Armatimonadota bacterium]
NHPLDCPVCDKGGECELQDRVFQAGAPVGRLTEPKIHIEDYDLGPLIVRNQDRCIVCKRCIKVMEEVVGDPVLEFGQRGVTTEVFTFAHEDFPPGFSGNTIQVCPVGALMSKPFRFKARPWELIKTPSVCSLCGVGCNFRQDSRENKLMRVVGLENPAVNDGWLCDRGQFGYDYVHSAARVAAPLIRRRRDAAFEAVSWEEALAFTVERLRAIRDAHGGAAIGALGSERTGNEDNFVLQHFVREVLGSPHLDYRAGFGRDEYHSLRPGPGAIQALGTADVVLLFASDLTTEAPVLDLVLKRGLLPNTMRLLIANPRRINLNKFASQWLRYTPGAEAALANALVKAVLEAKRVEAAVAERVAEVQAVEEGLKGATLAHLCATAGVDEAEVRAAAQAFADAKQAAVVYGTHVAEGRNGLAVLGALQNLAVLTGQAAKPGHVFLEAVLNCNTWGARDMGLLPGIGPGGADALRGMTTPEMLRAARQGKIRAFYIVGSNPAVDYPGDATPALRAAEFLVVQELFLTETAQLADVVLPAAALAEKNATLTNVEGRVQRAVRSLNPRGAARPDWEILSDLATALGRPLGYTSVEQVAREIRRALTSGGSPDRIRTGPRLQRVDAAAVPTPPKEFPLRLITSTLMFDRGSVQRECQVLPTLCPDPYVELHPEEAARLGVAEGQPVKVASPHGETTRQVRISEDTPMGAAFVPAGYNASPVARLLAEDGGFVGVRISAV